MTRRTERENYMELLEMVEGTNDTLSEFLKGKISQLDQKSQRDKEKRAEKNAVNADLAQKVLDYIKEAQDVVNAVMIKDNVEGVTSTQKASSIVSNYLVEKGLVEKVKIDKHIFYKAVA